MGNFVENCQEQFDRVSGELMYFRRDYPSVIPEQDDWRDNIIWYSVFRAEMELMEWGETVIQALINQGDFQQAIRYCEYAILSIESLFPDQVRCGRIWYMLGKIYFLQDRFTECLACLIQAVKDKELLDSNDYLELWRDLRAIQNVLVNLPALERAALKWKAKLDDLEEIVRKSQAAEEDPEYKQIMAEQTRGVP